MTAKAFIQNAFQIIVHPTLLCPPVDPTRRHRCRRGCASSSTPERVGQLSVSAVGCDECDEGHDPHDEEEHHEYAQRGIAAPKRPAPVPLEPARVIASFPHDTGAYTEGLFYRDGELYESTDYPLPRKKLKLAN